MDGNDDINNSDKRKMMFDLYEQCKYKMQIINKKNKKCWRTHTCNTQHTDNNHSNINNKK